MRFLAAVAAAICVINLVIGKTFAWLALAIVIVCFTVVVQRYVFAVSFVWMQDLYIWLNGAMFTAVAAFALLRDDHVRVDIFYRPASMRRRAMVDLAGVLLFLLPFTWVVYTYSMPFVARAWSYREASANVGGMPGLYILKSFVIAFALLICPAGTRHADPLDPGSVGQCAAGSGRDAVRPRPRARPSGGSHLMDPVLIGEVLAALMFFGVIGFLLLGFPVAFTLAGVSLLFGATGMAFGVFDPSNFGSLPSRYIGFMTNEVLVAVPLFIFMGVMLERSQIAEQLLLTMSKLFGNLRGGLGLSVILVGAMLAASTGVVGATVVTMGLISLPAMLRAGYDPKLATGVICASGTLGQIIPPSTVLIFMGDMLSGINSQVQMAKGNFAPVPVSVGDLFAGAMLPGMLLVGLYLVWVMFKAVIDPESCPATPVAAEDKGTLLREVLTALVPPLCLILAVLGSILGGIATPTEAASVGAVGAMLLAALRWRLSLSILRETVIATATITSMVFVILLGASVFSVVFRMMGGDNLVHEFLSNLPGGTLAAVAVVMLIMFLLGFILDTFEIIFIVIPITAPVLLALDVDPVWLGVIVGVNLQTSFLTPPFGFALFYLRGVAPAELPTSAIYSGILPFVVLQIVAIAILFAFPGHRDLAAAPDRGLNPRPAAAMKKACRRIGGRPGFAARHRRGCPSVLEVFLAGRRVRRVDPLGPGPHEVERLDEALGGLLDEGVVAVAQLLDHLDRRLGPRFHDVVGEVAHLHAVVVDQRLERARVVGDEVGRDHVVFGLAHVPDDRLKILGQRLVLGLVDHQFGREARFHEGRHVVVLGDLVEPEREVVVGADELGRVQRARLQRLEDLARGHVGDRRAQLFPDPAAKPRRAEADALDVVEAGQLVAEPAARLRAGVARQEPLDAELVIDLVPDLLAAQEPHPGGQLGRGHAVGHAGEERQRGRLVLPVIGRTVAHFGAAVDHRVQRLQRRHHLARRIDLHRQPATRSRGHAVGKPLRADAEAGKVLGPGGDHAPGDVALRDGGRGKGRGGGPCPQHTGAADERTTIHDVSSRNPDVSQSLADCIKTGFGCR